jgi:hypothetical protein
MRTDREQPSAASTRSSMNQDSLRFWPAIKSSVREGMVFVILLISFVFLMLLLNASIHQAWLWLEQAFF